MRWEESAVASVSPSPLRLDVSWSLTEDKNTCSLQARGIFYDSENPPLRKLDGPVCRVSEPGKASTKSSAERRMRRWFTMQTVSGGGGGGGAEHPLKDFPASNEQRGGNRVHFVSEAVPLQFVGRRPEEEEEEEFALFLFTFLFPPSSFSGFLCLCFLSCFCSFFSLFHFLISFSVS